MLEGVLWFCHNSALALVFSYCLIADGHETEIIFKNITFDHKTLCIF